MAEFSEATTAGILAKACAQAGLAPDGARLLRLGENAIYRLRDDAVVVRIARSLDHLDAARKEMRVSRWLGAAGCPAVRLADLDLPGDPLIIDGHPTTFWERVDESPEPPTPADLGRLLRELHGLEPPGWLPPFQPFDRVGDRLADAADRCTEFVDEVAFLRELERRLRAEYQGLRFDSPPVAVHGDAHPGNLMRRASGEVILIDFEAFCVGPREWDLALAAAYRYAFDWYTADEYRAFAAAYGYDVAEWAGCSTLGAIRELGMTTWLMQLVGDPAAAREFRQRVADMRSERFPRRWQAF